MTGSGKSMFSRRIGASGRSERVAGDDLLDADARGDVARVDLVDLLAVVRVHHQDAPDALGATGGDVEDAAAGGELAGVDAEVRELADERVGHDLEGERRERRVVVGLAHGGLAVVAALLDEHALERRDVQRGGQVVQDRVEQGLHALVLERRAAEDRGDLDRSASRVRIAALSTLDRDRVPAAELVERELGEVVVELGELVEQVLARGDGLIDVHGRDVDDVLSPCRGRPCRRSPSSRRRSMMPVNSDSAPTGSCTGTAFAPRRSIIVCTEPSKSAPMRSILLMNAMRGTSYLSAWRQTVSDCGSTPATESKTAMAPSSTRSERSTSTVKSTWPGVSMMLMR